MKKKAKTAIICVSALAVCAGIAIGKYAGKSAKQGKAVTVSSSLSTALIDGDPVFYTAHRGFSGAAPENTLAAAAKAAEAGYYACEFDIRPSKDGVWFVMHDESIDRMTDGKGKLADYTYAELLEFNIDSGNNINEYEDLKIPTLEQMLDECKKYSLKPMIEIKSGQRSDIDSLISILEARGIINDVIIIAFDFSHLEYLRAYSNKTELWFLIGQMDAGTAEKCAAAGNIGVAFDGRIEKNRNFIQSIFDAGLTAAAWTIDNIKLHDELYNLGVRYITTNLITP